MINSIFFNRILKYYTATIIFFLILGSNSSNYFNTNAPSWISLGPEGEIINAIAIDPKNPNVIYAGYSTTWDGGVFKSTTGGSNWTKVSTELSNMPNVHALAIDPKNTNIIYAGTMNGVFKSTNGGKNWVQIGTD